MPVNQASLRPVRDDGKPFAVFLSYGQDAKPLKLHLRHLIERGFGVPLSLDLNWRSALEVWEWPDVRSQKAPHGGKTNDIFVQYARDSSVTIVLLVDRVPPGTEEELLAILEEDDVDLKVFWLKRQRRWTPFRRRETEVEKLMRERQDEFKYTPLPDLGSPETWVEMTRELVATLLAALHSERVDEREPSEVRP
jgi:hypothetical protein